MNIILRSTLAACAAACLCMTGCDTPSKKTFSTESYTSFCQYIDEHNPQVVDVRSADEYVKGHLQNAINIDVKQPEFSSRAASVLEKSRPIAVYCRSGKRSKIAADLLTDMGYTVIELEGGIMNWKGKLEYGVN